MTDRVSLLESYDDRSVIAKLNEMDKRITADTDSIESTIATATEAIDAKVTVATDMASQATISATTATDAASSAQTSAGQAASIVSNCVKKSGQSSQSIDGTIDVDTIIAGTNSEIAGASFETNQAGATVIGNDIVFSDVITMSNGYIPSHVDVSASGTATDEIKYITVDGTQHKIAGAVSIDAYTKDETDTLLSQKQDRLTASQLAACGSGITMQKVATYDGYASAIAGKQDAGDYATNTQLATKQDKLTAGTNITIQDNVISATGGSSLIEGTDYLNPTHVQDRVDAGLSEAKSYVDSEVATKQDKGSYATTSDIADMLTKTEASSTYQAKGNYATTANAKQFAEDAEDNAKAYADELTSDMLTKTEASSTYQPKGSYASPSDVATAKSEAITTAEAYTADNYQVKGDYALKSDITSVYRVKGSVATADDLPSDASTGDVYNVLSTGMNFVWTGTAWDALGSTVDLSEYAKSADVTTEVNAGVATAEAYTDTKLAGYQPTGDYATKTDAQGYADSAQETAEAYTDSEVAKKQNTLSDAELSAVDSGITADKVAIYDGYATTIAGKQAQFTKYSVSLPSAGWDSSTLKQAVSVGVTWSDDDLITIDATPATKYMALANGVYCSAEVASTGSLTFTCTTVPSGDITLTVVKMVGQ